MARYSAAYASNPCFPGCIWTGRVCDCDVSFRSRGFRGAGLGLETGTKKLLAVGFLMAAAVGGAVAGSAIKKHTVRRRY